jgi:hypothetical protein
VVEEETEAAAAPAKTMDRARIRIASFIVGNLFQMFVAWNWPQITSIQGVHVTLNRNLSTIYKSNPIM